MLDYNYTIQLQQDMTGFDVICTNLSNESFCWVLCGWSFQVLGEIAIEGEQGAARA